MQDMAIFGLLCACVAGILGYGYKRHKGFIFITSMAALLCFGFGLAQLLLFESSAPLSQSRAVFVLDVSKSMQARDIFPSRLSFAIKKLQMLLKTHKPCASIIIFAQNAYLFSPFSCDYLTQIEQLQRLDSAKLPWREGVFEGALDSGGSNGALALEAVKLYGERIIVLSDGEFVPRGATLWLFATPQGSVVEIDSKLLYDEGGNAVHSAPLPEAMREAIAFSYGNKDIQAIAPMLAKTTNNSPQSSSLARLSIALGLVLLFMGLYGQKLSYLINKRR
ncbi:VWA domain-containing protein [uncultured Helicobacter sp.]|uniref:vWA domain-containing protein n=1 Tax=uncultured Helicobacter sp. TaxID=175537 RepID=UPI00374FF483